MLGLDLQYVSINQIFKPQKFLSLCSPCPLWLIKKHRINTTSFLSNKWITCPIEPDMQIDKFSFTTENTEDTEGRKNDRIKKNDEN